MVAQYTTLQLLPEWAQLIDDIEYLNFNVPVLMHQSRVLKHVDGNVSTDPGHIYTEADYADAKPAYDYAVPEFVLRSKVSDSELQQLVAINATVQSCVSDKSITRRALKRCLTAAQLVELDESVNTAEHPSEVTYGGGVPHYLRTYKQFLQRADFVWHQYERAAGKQHKSRKYKSNQKLEEKSEYLYELAFENLCEIYGDAHRGNWGRDAVHQIETWLDRTVVLDPDDVSSTSVTLGAHSMPRVRGSKSQYAQDSGVPKLSATLKRKYCTLKILLEVACNYAFVMPKNEIAATPEQTNRLSGMLKRLKRTTH